jgi:hypothetical protein
VRLAAELAQKHAQVAISQKKRTPPIGMRFCPAKTYSDFQWFKAQLFL